jgi:hypothetical protein
MVEDKSDLHELSRCLSQASSLINAILKQPERTPQSIQNERRQREFDNDTCDMNNEAPRHNAESENRPSSGEASTSQHVSVVSSAVNRARLMIQQSSCKGLYLRLEREND